MENRRAINGQEEHTEHVVARSPNVCSALREQFPDYLDGSLTGREMQTLAAHLRDCRACDEAFRADRSLQQVLAGLGPARAPDRLQARLMATLAEEQKRGTHLDLVSRLRRDWPLRLAPMALRVSGGLAAAVLLLGSASLFLADNLPVQANDERMAHLLSPSYLYSDVPTEPFDQLDPVMVDAKVDERGRVYDYSLVAGKMDAASRVRVEQDLLTRVYRPATVFGAPVRGHVMVTYSGVSVRG